MANEGDITDGYINDPFLNPHDGPVVPGLEGYETVYAREQPQYRPLRALRMQSVPGVPVLSRWTLTPEQRQAVASGADIYLQLLTFGNDLQPCLLSIGEPAIVGQWVEHDGKHVPAEATSSKAEG
jgi:hypothetical protein